MCCQLTVLLLHTADFGREILLNYQYIKLETVNV